MISFERDKSAFELLRATGRLPSPRGVAVRLIQLTQQEEVSIPELARVIGGDPALVGRIIMAANGVLQGVRRPVMSVSEALMVLGIPAVRTLATGFSLLSDHRSGRCQGFDYEHFWSFSVALAIGLQVAAGHTRAAASDEAFSLGLLLRVGELALATVYPEAYAQLLQQWGGEDEKKLLELESEAFAVHHGELSAELLEHWGVPGVFIQVARFYDDPAGADFETDGRRARLLAATEFARRFAQFCLAAEPARSKALEILLSCGEAQGVPREELLGDCRRMFEMWGEWIDLLQLEPSVSRSFPQVEAPAASAPRPAVTELTHSERRKERVATVPPGRDKPLVLVVENEDERRQQVVDLLAEEECAVAEIADFTDALDSALELQPHMMVLGCHSATPEIVELVAALRRTSLGRVMHLLLRVGDASDEALIALLEAGGDDALPRTVAPRLLQARLRAGLREVRLQRELEYDRMELHGFAAQLAITNRRLRDMALTDALTGFRNRRYAMDRIEQEWAVAERGSHPLSCMVIDVDSLKEINDAFGHDAGDRALIHATRTLRKALRAQDVICRIGGDEFLVICPGADLAAVLTGAERARLAVAAEEMEFEGRRSRLSVSIGVATIGPDVPDAAALMKLADRGAYVAKEAGRNRICAIQQPSRK